MLYSVDCDQQVNYRPTVNTTVIASTFYNCNHAKITTNANNYTTTTATTTTTTTTTPTTTTTNNVAHFKFCF